MARIPIQFTGLTSNANHKDGECSNIVNLRPKNGYLKPVPPRKVTDTLSQEYEIVFIHRIGDVENWIGISQSSIHAMINTPLSYQLAEAAENINSVQQIGNTLSFITDSNIYYALWVNGAYKYLGVIPDLPVVSFKTPAMTVVSATYKSEYGSIPVPPGGSFEKLDILTDATIGIAKKLMDENEDHFQDAFFVRYAFRLYDGSILKESSPILIMPQDIYTSWGVANLTDPQSATFGDDSNVTLKLFTLQLDYDLSIISEWKDIIKSVDFFTTNYVGLANAEEIGAGFYDFGIFGVPPVQHNLYPPYYGLWGAEKPTKSLSPIEKCIETSQYYLYYSDDSFDGRRTPSFPNLNSTLFPDNRFSFKGTYNNIIHQEKMPSDSFSHHAIGADNATIYNNRLRLSSLRTTLYEGHPIQQFIWGSNYNGVERTEGLSSSSTGGNIFVFVDIKTTSGEFIVRKYNSINVVYFLGAFISYPDPRATKIRVYTGAVYGEYKLVLEIALSPHPRLNIAYAINGLLKPYIQNIESASSMGSPYFDSIAKILEPNKLKVSELNNPFVFPNLNTYQVGSGKILAESSIIMNVSDRNYGMYPVFVFTDSGVFTMAAQTGDSVHDSIQAPTYLEPPISPIICATPSGVAFITKRGLMMISQNSTEFISPQLREDGDYLYLQDNTGSPLEYYEHEPGVLTEENTFPVDNITFNEFLSKASNMLYNSYYDELIIFSSITNKYCYVYDFPSQSFYLSTEKATGIVQNAFPSTLVVDGVNIKDFSQYDSYANISLITRPMYFGSTDIKTMNRIMLRMLGGIVNMKFIAFHSMDSVNFTPAKGREINHDESNVPRSYIDFDLGMLARETYRQYLLTLSGYVHKDLEIRYAEFEASQRYNNDKMR